MSTDSSNPNTPGNVALWSAANANLFQNNLATAAMQAAKNSDGTPAFPNFSNTPIPFGSTINVTNPSPAASGGKLAQTALAALAALGVGSGAISLLKLNQPAAAIPAAVVSTANSTAPALPTAPSSPATPATPTAPPVPRTPTPAGPVTIEGILNWELTPDGGLSTSIEPGPARPAASGS